MPSKLDDAYRSPYDRRIPSSILYKPDTYTRNISNLEHITDYTLQSQPLVQQPPVQQQGQQPLVQQQSHISQESDDECINLITSVLNKPKCIKMLRMLLISSDTDEKTSTKKYDYKFICMITLVCILGVFVLLELVKLLKG